MKSAIATLACYPPDLDVNPSPSGLHDRVIGMASGFFNSMIQSMKLNVTVIGVKMIGSCRYIASLGNDSCDGAVKELATGRADFTLIPVTPQVYDYRSKRVPFLFGPKLYEAEMTFTSEPYEASKQQPITILHHLTEMPVFLALQLLCVIALIGLINFQFFKMLRISVRKVRMIQVLGLLLMKPGISVIVPHQRIAFACCLILAAFSFQILTASMGSSMVVILPAKYYETLNDVAASNATPTMLAGIEMDIIFKESKDPARHAIRQRAIDRKTRYASNDTSIFMKIANDLRQTVSLFHSKLESGSVIGMNCVINNFSPSPSLRESRQFERVTAIMAYSRSIKPDLRRHLSHFFQSAAETGIYHRRNNNAQSSLSALGNTDRLVLCMERMGKEEKQDSHVLPWNLSFFPGFGIMLLLLYLFSIACVTWESGLIRRTRHERPKATLKNLKPAAFAIPMITIDEASE
jgi:hypothetical protein